MNVQYHGSLHIGGQEVTAILDSGSFELLVMSERCGGCTNPPYNSNNSETFRAEGEVVRHDFASGPTLSMRGYEQVTVGPLSAPNQTFYEILKHNITSLNSGSFDTIAGIGPEDPNSTRPSLLSSFGVSEYSICLGRESLSPGWLTWGSDLSPAQKKESVELEVVGKRHWAVAMTGVLPVMPLSGKQEKAAGTLFCERGCAAILDSGTSLLTAPSHALRGLELLLPALHQNCSNFEDLPDLQIVLDGHKLLLPPESYVMRLGSSMVDSLSMSVWEKLHFKPDLAAALGGQCFYGFLGMDIHTDFGPLWILGMPFFRQFHATFGLAKKVEDRRIYLSSPSDNCDPLPLDASKEDENDPEYEGAAIYPKVVVAQTKRESRRVRSRQPMTIDAASIRLPANIDEL